MGARAYKIIIKSIEGMMPLRLVAKAEDRMDDLNERNMLRLRSRLPGDLHGVFPRTQAKLDQPLIPPDGTFQVRSG